LNLQINIRVVKVKEKVTEDRRGTVDNFNSEEDCFQYHSVRAFYVMKRGESGKKYGLPGPGKKP